MTIRSKVIPLWQAMIFYRAIGGRKEDGVHGDATNDNVGSRTH